MTTTTMTIIPTKVEFSLQKYEDESEASADFVFKVTSAGPTVSFRFADNGIKKSAIHSFIECLMWNRVGSLKFGESNGFAGMSTEDGTTSICLSRDGGCANGCVTVEVPNAAIIDALREASKYARE